MCNEQIFLENLIIRILQNIENNIKNIEKDFKNNHEWKKYLNDNIGKFYKSLIIPNIYFIRLLILVSIEGGDFIKFNHKYNWKKILNRPYNLIRFLTLGNALMFTHLSPFAKLIRKIIYEKDFENIYQNDEIEEINIKNLFYKTKIKKIIKSDNSKDKIDDLDDIINRDFEDKDNFLNFLRHKNRIYDFSLLSEKCIFGEEYYNNFLQILNNYSNDFQADIEVSIYDNLKEENLKREDNFSVIKDTINDLIDDEESKKGFFALLRQSYLLGGLRSKIVRKLFIII